MKIRDILRPPALHVEIGYLNFIWEGGAYIDILIRCDCGDVEYTDQCINVWDYAEGKASIPFTTSSLINEANNWIGER